jgi:hypothetical protein
METVGSPPDAAGGLSPLVALGRDSQRAVMRAEAQRLDVVARVLAECESDVPTVGLQVLDRAVLVRDAATGEVAVTFGVSEHVAARWVALAERLTTVLPVALQALRDGVLDLARVQVLAEGTAVLDDDLAASVAAELIAGAGGAPWDGPSPRAWKRRVDKAVTRADRQAAAARHARQRAARRVRAWADCDGAGVFQLRADAGDVAMIDRVVNDLAMAGPTHDGDGVRLTLDQRRADAVINLFRRIREHGADADLPKVPVRRVTDLGVVLHVDTLFGDGPRRDATGEQRGLGHPAVLDPATARERAQRELAHGTKVQVLVVDDDGGVKRVVRLPASACTSRQTLLDAVRSAPLSPLCTDRYAPTTAITRHVHAAAPTCSAYDCARVAVSCDLDHDEPWPRGPTDTRNLDPKCRRHHQLKTHGIVRTRLRAGPGRRSVTWTYGSGLAVTTTPEPLPGCH